MYYSGQYMPQIELYRLKGGGSRQKKSRGQPRDDLFFSSSLLRSFAYSHLSDAALLIVFLALRPIQCCHFYFFTLIVVSAASDKTAD